MTADLPEANGSALTRWLLFAAVLFIGAGIYAYLSSHAYLKLDVDTDQPTYFRVYWKTADQTEFNHSQSTHLQILPGKRFYSAMMDDLRGATQLRIDPTNGAQMFRITELSIYQPGYQPIRFMRQSLKQLTPGNGVGIPSLDAHGLVYQATSWDSYFLADIHLRPETDSLWTHAWRLAIWLIALLLLLRAYPALVNNYHFVPYTLLVAFLLASVMSVISRPHAHPDEHAHLQAARYYEEHHAPPPACDADSLHTYTVYGTSRLNTNELTYLIAGKFLQLTDTLPLDYYAKLRGFNLLLFGLLVWLAFARTEARIVLLPLTISPQFWYIFSYFNSDALAITTGLLTAWQVATPGSAFRQLIRGDAGTPLRSGLLLALLALFLFFTKKNFYFFGLFLAGAALVFSWAYRSALKPALLPVATLLVLAGGAFGGWSLYQNQLHDGARAQKLLECREQTAEREYRPSTPLSETTASLNLRKRGVALSELFGEKYTWPKRMFMSSFGNYGYVSLPAGRPYYQIVALLLLGLGAVIAIPVIVRGSAVQRWLLAGFIGLVAAMIALTLYRSWTINFQPQGRYYFPMIAAAGALLGWLRHRLSPKALSAFVLGLWAMGVISFVSIGLIEIPRVGY